jgi:primase-polymerase (primpol)-like protein
MDDTQVPAVLQEAAQWVCWRVEERDGEATKVPVDPATGGYASVAEPGTWGEYADAVAYRDADEAVAGIGFVFTAEDPYTGVDLDDCREPVTGRVEDWAQDVLRRLESYTEVSPSGTGFHVIVKGGVPAGGNRRGQLEMYDRDRYFTVTGDRVPGAPTTVEERVDALRAVHEEYIAGDDEAVERPAGTEAVAVQDRGGVAVADDELVERAMDAANGEKFRRLWNGDTSGYPSHSEADQALCNLLAFWTGGDPARMERLFNRSGLVRAKWRNRPDYRERTIRNAIQSCSEFYDPGEGDDSG